jgi:nucleoside-diphosphate-sugar epimerase
MIKSIDLFKKIANNVKSRVIAPEEIKDKKVLITGASGVLGIHFVNYFTSIGCKPDAIVASPIPPYFPSNIYDGCRNVFYMDLANEKYLKMLGKYNIIIHCAGYSSPKKFMEEKLETIKIGINATEYMLSNMLDPADSFLFISSSEIYNGSNGLLVNENDVGHISIDDPRVSYIETKKMGEILVNIARERRINAKSVRVCLSYGTGTKINDKRVLHEFIDKALINGEIKMVDAGKATRAYCFIEDSLEMMLNVLFYGKENVYNIGSKDSISILGLAQLISWKIDGVNVLTHPEGMSVIGSPKNIVLDISRYEKEFGKKEFIPLEVGLNDVIEWQRYILEYSQMNNIYWRTN